ncbi:hypothetical protein HUN59_05305 [Curtobacterium sp. Csp2]|uniref:hypothetical protein n=1 Tax=Curtobacterium sp. Csp2 TaxID=2495430 RepID=UPI001581155F|nr:hypothetical protein [Curtobacterium sp. Csp2]QKS15714.1 hypothetical protein HUN59_05305 [Curtobacterium sp. Csp2]
MNADDRAVQVPVPLIESLAKRADQVWANNIARDLRAPLSQPTSTAETPHTPFCIRTSTPDKPCRCWKSGSTDEEDQ